jgi:hypothetical protein
VLGAPSTTARSSSGSKPTDATRSTWPNCTERVISERSPCDAVSLYLSLSLSISLSERIEIDLAEPCEDHRVPKLARRRIAGAGERQSARVFERERASPAFGHDWA